MCLFVLCSDNRANPLFLWRKRSYPSPGGSLKGKKKNKWSGGIAAYVPLERVENDKPRPPPPPPLKEFKAEEFVNWTACRALLQLGHASILKLVRSPLWLPPRSIWVTSKWMENRGGGDEKEGRGVKEGGVVGG